MVTQHSRKKNMQIRTANAKALGKVQPAIFKDRKVASVAGPQWRVGTVGGEGRGDRVPSTREALQAHNSHHFLLPPLGTQVRHRGREAGRLSHVSRGSITPLRERSMTQQTCTITNYVGPCMHSAFMHRMNFQGLKGPRSGHLCWDACMALVRGILGQQVLGEEWRWKSVCWEWRKQVGCKAIHFSSPASHIGSHHAILPVWPLASPPPTQEAIIPEWPS